MTTGFDDRFFEMLADAEERSFWFRARTKLILYALQRHERQATSFLEVGCGNGLILAAVAAKCPQWRVAGTDAFRGGLDRAQQRTPRATLLQIEASAIPFTQEFDAAGAFDVLEHIDDDVGAVRGLHRALAPGGILLVTVPQHRWLWSGADDFAHHRRRYTRRELVTKLRDAGFTIELATSFVSLLLPAMLGARIGKKKKAAVAELRLPRFINAIFEAIMTIERAMIRLGIRFPFGGSLLVVARRAAQEYRTPR